LNQGKKMAYTVDTLLDALEENMMKSEDALNSAFAGIRTGKASPALVENITFEYYGTQTRIRDAAGITAPEPRLLVIQPWDASAVKGIEKAILASNIGITPMSDGKTLKLPIPELSQDRRQALAKQAKSAVEEAKVALRNLRREGNDAVKKALKDSDITEDENKKLLDDVQKLTDRYIASLDKELTVKEKELMTV
jgi:ribosome recycling factor